MSVYNTYKDLAGLNFNFVTIDTDYNKDKDKDNQKKKLKEIVCYCEDGPGAIMCHYECSKCGNLWCPEDKSVKQETCPNCKINPSDPNPIVE
jgi:hypothetical protein